ncbi:MAG: penicillin-binding protein [Candidatus Pacebacteria bacterium]|nr:penicillin-binding protein [Candidatus Paceibacterota bacterium]
MKKNKSFVNKYERAYLNKLEKMRKKRFIRNQRPSLGKIIVYNFYFYKRRFKMFIKDFKQKRIEKTLKKDINKNQKPLKEKVSDTTVNTKKIKRKKIREKKEHFVFSAFIKKIMSDIKKTKKNKKTKKRKIIKRVKKRVPLKKKVTKKPKNKNTKKRKIWTFLKWLISVGVILTLVGFGLLFIWFTSLEIPSVENFDKRKISNSTKIFDKTGKILLYDIHENIQRTVVTSDKISKNAKNAIIAIEDHNFYKHDGVVWKSTIRAVVQTVLSRFGFSVGGSAGGSTLTQQVVKNTLLTKEKTLTRKMKEWVLAYKIEDKLSKDEILTVYLNEAPYGGTIYGIQEASRVFFGKTAKDLSIAESAYLASIPNLPTFYSPYGSNKDLLDKRQKTVLREMKRYGYISDSDYRTALAEQVEFLRKEDNYAKALHFVQYVRSLLEDKYGVDVVENGGLRVITSLDYKLQQKAEEIIKEHVEGVADKDASNAALVAIETETGNIITMVGSRDYFDTENFDGNFNVALSPRQPGSSFKPFAYAAAFEKGYLPESAIFDTPTQFNSRCEADEKSSKDGCYFPGNWDNKFKGAISFREALAQSRNIPAIKILHLTGISNVIKKAQEMGISSLTQKPSYYGLGLVLGGGEVSLLEMVSAYTTFPNNGKHIDTNAILSITDVEGNILEEHNVNEVKVFSKNAARMVSNVLSDNIARTPLYGSNSLMYFGSKNIAGKTGTTNDKRDAWMIGYSSDVAVGVWTGNNDNSPMKVGSKISMKPWRLFMDEIIDEYVESDFKNYDIPEDFESLPNMIKGNWEGSETYKIDSVSGKLATEFTPEHLIQLVTRFEPHTILHSVNKSNPQKPGNSQSDSQYSNWEYSVNNYSQEHYAGQFQVNQSIPTEYDDVHSENGIIQEGDFDFDIENIQDEYELGDIIEIELDFNKISTRDIEDVLYYINNSFTGSVGKRPFDINFKPIDILYLRAENTIRVVATDEDGKKVSREANFSINLPDDFELRENEEIL